MSDFALGSALVVPDGLIEDLARVDQHIESIQKNAGKAATKVASLAGAFEKLKLSLNPTADDLERVVRDIQQLSSSRGLAQSMSSAATQTKALSGAITEASANVDKLNNKKVTTFESAMSSANSASTIKERTTAIKELIQVRENLSTKDADYATKITSLNNAISQLSKANKEATMTAEEKAQADAKAEAATRARERAEIAEQRIAIARQNVESAQTRATARQANAEIALANAQARAAKSQAANVTNMDEAMAMANAAKSINERTNAIKALINVRNNLSTQDANYKSNLTALNNKIKELTQSNKEAAEGAKVLSNSYNSLAGIAERMGKRLLVLFSLDAIKDFANQIVQVRANFEMQQRSLEAILQSKSQADTIFQQDIQLAVKSPFKIQELVTYTKQLAAYRIESDKLFDTTKRLADVSAGLGVDMQRLILAYGQVKAAAYLRGTEVRQFTEAGVNMYGELQKYYQEIKGEAYSTAEIVDMISKRKVTFEDVEAIFKRLTDKGGTFYNMQEIQSETLQGKISNLADSFDLMYNEMGKAHEGLLKNSVDTTKYLVQHWETIAEIIERVIQVLAILFVYSKRAGLSFKELFSSSAIAKAGEMKSTFAALGISIKSLKTGIEAFGRSLKAAFMSNAALIAIMALIEAIYDLWSWSEKAADLADETAKKYTDEANVLNGLVKKYKDLAEARKEAENSGKSKEAQDDLKLQIGSVDELVNHLESLGVDKKAMLHSLGISEALDTLSSDQIDVAFQKILKYAQEVNDTMNQMGTAYNDVATEVEGWFNIFGDNIETDQKDLASAENDLIAKANDMSNILDAIGANYDNLTDRAKIYYNSVKKGQDVTNGEDTVTWLTRLQTAYENIIQEQLKSQSALQQGIGMKLNGMAIDFDWGDFNSQKEEWIYEIDKLKKKIHETDPIKLKAAIDQEAADKSWTEYQKHLAYQEFQVPLTFNVDNPTTDNSITMVQQYLQDLSDSGTFKIDVTAEIDTTGLSEFVKTGDEAAKAAKEFDKQYQRMTDGLNRTKTKRVKVDQEVKKVLDEAMPMNTLQIGDWVDTDTVRSALKTLKKEYTNLAKDFGVNPFETKRKKKGQEIDWVSLEIEALEKMQQRYQGLIKYMGQEDAGALVLKQFSATLKEVRMPNFVTKDYTEQSKSALADAIEKLIPSIKDQKKKIEAQLKVDSLRIEVNQEKLKNSLDNAKKLIDSMMDQVDLHTKLKDIGLSEEEITSMFGPMTNTLASIREKAIKTYETIFGKQHLDWDSDQTSEFEKAYDETLKKIKQKQEEQDLSTFEDLVKNYKSKLTEQLQLDDWYSKERARIYSNQRLTRDTSYRDQLLENLDTEYKTKSDQNTWKDFQESGFYTSLFQNLDSMSSKVLTAMSARLNEVRSSMNGLDPSALKAIAEQEEKLQDALINKNPFKAMITNIKKYNALAKDRKKIETNLMTEQARLVELDAQSKDQQAEITELEVQREKLATDKFTDHTEEIASIDALLQKKRDELAITKKLKKATQDEANTDATATQKIVSAEDKKRASIAKTIEIVNSAASSLEDFYKVLSGDSTESTETLLNGINSAGEAVAAYYSGNYAQMVSSGMSALSSFYNYFSGDMQKQEKIEKMQKQVEQLANTYNRLKDAMDEAWNSDNLIDYKEQTVENLKAQIALYKSMIKTEESKKHTDKDQIKEYENEILDLEDSIKEAEEDFIESLGGIGESNYKSAAQEFADAWFDAFNESSDSLEALEDTFDDYFDNLMKKQIMNIASKKYLQKVFDKFDQIVSEGSAGGNSGTDVTAQELAELQKLKDQSLQDYNDYVSGMMEMLNITPDSSSSLSALQQGIQSVTESTAEALESLLNSMRFSVTQQTEDVSAIRNLIQYTIGTPVGDTTVIKEMQTQTKLQQRIADLLDSVTKTGHSQGGYGLKVFSN